MDFEAHDRGVIDDMEAQIARLQEQVETLRQAIAGKDRQMYPSVTHGQYLEMAATLHAAREGGISRAEAAEAERDRLREALRETDCPRPCNGRPDDFSAGDCFDAGECGCGVRVALQKEPQP